ncbi:MAG: PilZ domain-containing protein [Sphingomicrobium sp.]
MSEKTQSACAERESRRDIDLQAYVFRNDGSRPLVRLANISYEGCQLADGPDFEAAEPVTLVLPDRGEVGACVRWSAAGRAGARFERDSRAPEAKPIFERPFYYGSGRLFGKRGTS